MTPRIQVYAIVRIDSSSRLPPGASGPGIAVERLRGATILDVTVQAVLPTQDKAVTEVERLNALNSDKDASYFWMTTRYYPEGRDGESE